MNLRLSGAVVALAFLALLPVPAFASNVISSSNIVALTNVDRTANGAGAVVEDSRLDIIAQEQAADMLARGYFSHYGPDGKSPWSWLIAGHYYYYFAGQNIAMGFTGALALEEAWMNSPAHRANILNPVYTAEGVGIATGSYLGKQTTFIVEFFATPPSQTAIARTNNTRS